MEPLQFNGVHLLITVIALILGGVLGAATALASKDSGK